MGAATAAAGAAAAAALVIAAAEGLPLPNAAATPPPAATTALYLRCDRMGRALAAAAYLNEVHVVQDTGVARVVVGMRRQAAQTLLARRLPW